MIKATSMLEISEIEEIGMMSLDSSSSISESTDLQSFGSDSPTTCALMPMFEGSEKLAIVAVEDDDDFIIGTANGGDEDEYMYEVPIAPPSDSSSPSSITPSRATLSRSTTSSKLPQRSSSCHNLGLSASLPAALPSSSGQGMRRSTSVSCLKRANSEMPKKPKRNISFSNLEIREYDLTLGDHPNCSYGPPVQLSWDYQKAETRNVDEYEAEKLDSSIGGRRRKVSGLSWEKREALLIRLGFSEEEIKGKMKEMQKIKMERTITKKLVVTGRTEEALESAARKLKRYLGSSNKGSTQQQRRSIFTHRK